MAKQVIGIGNAANDGSGDPLRTAGDKINDNFNEFYSKVGDGSNLHPLTFPNVTGTVLTTANSNVGATTTSSSDADHVLINDGGILKKITPANLGIGSGGGGVTIQDEGSALSTTGTTLNFVGAGVTASGTGATKTITIAGGSAGVTVQDEGSALSTAGTTLNFVGAGVTASGTGATKTITISGGGLSDTDALTEGSTNLYFTNARATTAITGSTLNMGSNDIITTGKILYSNNYLNVGDLPSASTYHGMFAHVHSVGAAYYAHAGNWVRLADHSNLYSDSSVDTHLNTGSAQSGEILSWNGSDYAWVTDQTGGSGTTDLNSLTAGVINTQNDSIGFIDADDSNNSKKESIADFLAAIAGTGISVSSGQLTAANVSTFGATLIDDANAAAARTTLGLGTMALATDDNTNFVKNETSQHYSGSQDVVEIYNDISYFSTPVAVRGISDPILRLTLNDNTTSYETLIEFKSDHGTANSTKGNIHYNTTDGLTLESNASLAFQSNVSSTLRTINLTNNAFSPITGDTGTLDLGTSSGKWKDIHLSGTANVGSIAYTFNVVNNGSSDYTFSDAGNIWFPSATNDPVLYLRRGEQYKFVVNASTHPFEIRVSNGGSPYNTGVTNNGAEVGTVTFKVPMSAPATLYYQCTNHSVMGNVINIV
tara:strand:+ start:156 stop:2120 length:1965 start_codon:yes stop_codon:yes gene_type:complete